MPWSGTGQFTRTDGTRVGNTVWQQARAANVKIVADGHDTHDQDIATGLNNCLTKDGQNSPTADIDWDGNRLTNLGDPQDGADAISQNAADARVQNGTAVFAEAGGTADALTATLAPAPSELVDGMEIRIRAAAANTTTTPTLDLNSLGAKTITRLGDQALQVGNISGAGHELSLRFNEDNDVWELLNPAISIGTDPADVPTVADLALFMRGHIAGLTLSNNATDAEHDIDIAAGVATAADQSVIIRLTSALTKRIDAAWAVGTGNGGLFSGSVANNTTYHVFLIRRSDTGVVDAGFDTSVTGANVPGDYDQKRRVGSVRTDDSANIRAFKQFGDTFLYVNFFVAESTTSPTSGASLLAMGVPTGVSVEALFWAEASSAVSATFLSPDQTTFSHGISNPLGLAPNGAGQYAVMTNASGQIRMIVSVTPPSPLEVFTFGWVDRRGKDD